jgi:hypothetical protein
MTLDELHRELKALREELAAERIARLSAPNAASSEEFLALFQAHRSLREDHAKLRERVALLESKDP